MIKKIVIIAILTTSQNLMSMHETRVEAKPVPIRTAVDERGYIVPTAVRSQQARGIPVAQVASMHQEAIPAYNANGHLITTGELYLQDDGTIALEKVPLAQQARQAFNYISGGMQDQGIISSLTGVKPLIQSDQQIVSSSGPQRLQKRDDLAPEGYDQHDVIYSSNPASRVSPYIQRQNERLQQAQEEVLSTQKSFASDPSVVKQYKTVDEMNQAATLNYLKIKSPAALAELLLSSPVRIDEANPISKTQVLRAISSSMADFLGINKARKAYANSSAGQAIDRQITNIQTATSKALDAVLGDPTLPNGERQSRINQVLKNMMQMFSDLAAQLGIIKQPSNASPAVIDNSIALSKPLIPATAGRRSPARKAFNPNDTATV